MSEAALTCANHPTRETHLRCNRCGKPICSQCAVLTPVGYRCRECVRGQQKTFDTTRWWDYPLAVALSAIGVGVGVGLLDFIGLWGIFVAPIAGGGLAEVVRWAVGRRRSRQLPLVATGGGVLGILPHLALPALALITAAAGGRAPGGIGLLFVVLWPLLNGALMAGTLFYRLRGIHM